AKGLEFLFRANGVEVIHGTARLVGDGKLLVQTSEQVDEFLASEIVVATGSRPAELSCLVVDGRRVLNSDDALDIVTFPESLAIVGAGAVGLEFATFFSRLGTRVVVVEMCEQVLPGIDREIAILLRRLMERDGVDFRLGAKVLGCEDGRLLYRNSDGSDGAVSVDRVLVATGRTPATEGLGLEAVGATVDGQGFVVTDRNYRSGQVVAIGDVRGGRLLAHKAMREGLIAAELIAGRRPRRAHAIPLCVYTDPEVASVGMSEEEARREGYDVIVVQVPASAVGRSLTLARSEGICRMTADARTGRILGVTMLCAQADVLIAEACLAVELRLKVDELGRAVHPHPTMSELLFEAAEAITGRAVHIINR
ncbi:MAG: NAD(P)/FAD-dependent oxidoreductase, partial [candidate division WOR-3 bacterium]